MSILLATLCLNEMEWLPYLYEQHKNWPDLAKWVFVEAADRVYANSNPTMVSKAGLSIDGTSQFLEELENKDSRVTYIPHGFSDHRNAAKGKIAARQRYLDIAEEIKPEFVILVDADEFYTYEHQGRLAEEMRKDPDWWAFTFPKREIWRPPSVASQPLFENEVVRGFWGIPCCHWWRWSLGLRYTECHNVPSNKEGRYLNDRLKQLHNEKNMPSLIHMGYAASQERRKAKHLYYANRGESRDRHRVWYVQSRGAWETWKPGRILPHGAQVIRYSGPIPEVFQ